MLTTLHLRASMITCVKFQNLFLFFNSIQRGCVGKVLEKYRNAGIIIYYNYVDFNVCEHWNLLWHYKIAARANRLRSSWLRNRIYWLHTRTSKCTIIKCNKKLKFILQCSFIKINLKCIKTEQNIPYSLNIKIKNSNEVVEINQNVKLRFTV